MRSVRRAATAAPTRGLGYSLGVTERREVPSMPAGISGLKRDPALQALSRDHHGALVQARALRLAAAGSAAERRLHPLAATARAFLDFYERELRGHFDDEERVLLPRCREADPGGVERILAEHRELHGWVGALRQALAEGGDPAPAMAESGQLLDDHVRFEERAFFEGVQRSLSAAALAEIGQALDANRAARGAPGCALPADRGESERGRERDPKGDHR